MNETNEELKRSKLPAMVALSHPCNKLPIAAATATSTAPLIFTENQNSNPLNSEQ